MKKGKRILTVVTPDYCIESPRKTANNGETSYDPVDGPKLALISTALEAGYQVDNPLNIPIGVAAKGSAECCTNAKKHYAEIQYNVDLAADQEKVAGVKEDGLFRLGLHANGYPIFGGKTSAEKLTISGKNGAQALEAIGQFAQHRKVKISRIHAEASSSEVFDREVTIKAYSMDGKVVQNIDLNWPFAKTTDQNLEVRDLYFPEGLILDGMNYFKMNMKGGNKVKLVVFAELVD